MYYIVGLGNPGSEYENTRHNTGRMVVERFAKANKFPALVFDKKINSLKSEVLFRGQRKTRDKILLLLPETMMNNSGNAVVKVVASKKRAENLIVVHDDLDLPLGKFKVSFARGSAGHRGVESVIKKIKTENFIRIRIGICPKKKPAGKDLLAFLLGKFSQKEMLVFKKTAKKAGEAISVIISEGLQMAMSKYN